MIKLYFGEDIGFQISRLKVESLKLKMDANTKLIKRVLERF